MNQLTPFVQRLLIINVVLFALSYIFDNQLHLYHYLILHGVYAEGFAAYQIVTNIFMHADFRHLFGNMLGLYFFGPLLEHFLGFKKFLILYFVCGVGAGLLYWGINAYQVRLVREDAIAFLNSPNPDSFNQFVDKHNSHEYNNQLNLIDAYAEHPEDPELQQQTKHQVVQVVYDVTNFGLLGASGAIFGILMAFALLFPNTELMLLFLPVPIKAKYLVGVYAAIEIYSLYANRPNDNVAHFVHIAGMIFAFILIRYWKTNRNSFY
ncbi:rhomboid family intramembrane serine protease [Cytophaga hutchinsonii]|uniref:Rhomboid family membrane protein n=1 Tax=Cytophaga hutchinsonii (strain ATCC 33406 / DSM 1761 / CIP 103989 / NBRC 15051 / NCIMB 9469 / D465) TaxID=269798 RepID=A0A6N4SM39_CYTH3|nr:rhomboid family intramembrane serine protease [Cytophaga hutchinsonii]ABG57309.1 rhomboid family membrane protein [Cytophaga hutchinsonii ATCC 33406]SFX46083.1 Rhomboid family protein [Cytophaga hutchinsonii ATCC 33406]